MFAVRTPSRYNVVSLLSIVVATKGFNCLIKYRNEIHNGVCMVTVVAGCSSQ